MEINGLKAYFYRSSAGTEPVRDWIKSLPKQDKKIIGEDIKTVQYGWPLGMPLVKSLGDSLWEVRSTLGTSRIARIIFLCMLAISYCCMGLLRSLKKHL